jgi:uncharacterized membrane protein
MSAISIPEEIAKELDERKRAIGAIDQRLQSLEAEANGIKSRLDEIADTSSKIKFMKENILNDIVLIESIINAFVNNSPQNKMSELSPTKQAVLKALTEASGPIEPRKLVSMTGLPRGTVAGVLHRLEKNGLAANDRAAHTWSIP